MENIKQLFEKIHKQFQHKKDFFKKHIERLSKKGNTEDYKKQNDLFLELEKADLELQNSFLLSNEKSNLNEQTLRTKTKTFKAQYKELNELTKPIWRQWIEAIVIAGGLVFIIRTFLFGLYVVPSGSAEPTILVGDHIWGNKFVYFFQEPKRGEFVIFDEPEFQLDESSKLQYFWQKYVGFAIPIIGLKQGPTNIVKRIIAVPGDKIEGRVEDGRPAIYLNDKKLDEPYINSYPLLRVQRTKGFIDSDLPILETLGLKYMVDPHFLVCTFDPSKTFADQPYYKINPDEAIRNPLTNAFMIIPPYTPTSNDIFGPMTVPQGKYWMMGDSRNNSHDSRWWSFLDRSQIHGRASFIILSIDTSESFFIYDLIKHPIDFWTKHIRWNRFFKGLCKYYGRPDLEK